MIKIELTTGEAEELLEIIKVYYEPYHKQSEIYQKLMKNKQKTILDVTEWYSQQITQLNKDILSFGNTKNLYILGYLRGQLDILQKLNKFICQ